MSPFTAIDDHISIVSAPNLYNARVISQQKRDLSYCQSHLEDVIVTFDDLFADIKSIILIVDDSPIVLAKPSDDLAGQYDLITAESSEEIVKILEASATPVGAFSFPLTSDKPRQTAPILQVPQRIA